MKNQHLCGLPKFIGLIIAIFLLVACAAPAPQLPQGRILLYATGNIFEIPSDSTAEKAADLRIAGPGITSRHFAFTLWPEKNYLAYRTENSVQLLDLDTREAKTLSTGPTDCVTWSPDMASISYVSAKFDGSELYSYDVASGTSTLVYATPSATYADGRTRHGVVTCGVWIGADRFVFNRTVGMPGQLTSINGVTEAVSTNTTTLAIIGESLTLVDSARELFIHDVSDDGRHLLFGQGDMMSTKLYHASLPVSFDNFKSLSPRLMDSGIVGNPTIMGNEVTYHDVVDGEVRIRIINLETFEERLSPTITGIDSWIWVGLPKDNLIAFEEIDSDGRWLGLRLWDLNTHGTTAIIGDALLRDMENLGLKEDVPDNYPYPILIGWLPPK